LVQEVLRPAAWLGELGIGTTEDMRSGVLARLKRGTKGHALLGSLVLGKSTNTTTYMDFRDNILSVHAVRYDFKLSAFVCDCVDCIRIGL
jgi:hypothetical protein